MKDELFCVDIRDASGSMFSMYEDVIGSTVTFVQEQKKEEGSMVYTVVDFDYNGGLKLNRRVTRQRIQDVNPNIEFKPEGGTPLYDAVGIVMDETGKYLASLPESERPDKVLFRIFTDGYENQSKEYTGKALATKIKHQEEKYNWQFQFLGAGIDAEHEGNKFGLNSRNTASYNDYDSMMTLNTSKVKAMRSSKNSMEFAQLASYTDEEKAELEGSKNA